MAPAVQKYFEDGLAPSTWRTYAAALKKFHCFCKKYNIASPFPVTEYLLCCFLAFLADQGLAPQTGTAYLAAVRSMQISLGLPDPRDSSSLPVLKRVQAGIKRARLARNTPPKVRLPITAPVLERIRAALNSSSHPQKVLIWTVACVAFFGSSGWLSEEYNPAVSLSWGDVAVDNQEKPTMAKIHLKKSKCDQFGSGADIVMGWTHTPLCPVAAVLSFCAIRQARLGPFFQDVEGKILTKSQFVKEIRDVLASLGLPQHQYTGHSFRIGAATSAALAGFEDSTIQMLGRWHSAAFLQYVRTPKERLAALSKPLAVMAIPK